MLSVQQWYMCFLTSKMPVSFARGMYSAFYKLGYISSRSKGSIIEPLEADTMGARSLLDLRSMSARSRLGLRSISAQSAFSVRSMGAR